MKYVNNILYLEFQDLLDSGISQFTIIGAKRDSSSGWNFSTDPHDRRKILVEYSSLKCQFKNIVVTKFGDPYQYLSSTIIKQHLSVTAADQDFIREYLIPDGNHLPLATQENYIKACAYLNLLSTTTCRQIKEIGFKTASNFYQAVIRLIDTEKVPLPTAYGRLKAKVRDYKAQGAKCVISRKFCNDNSKKVKDEVSEAVLLEMISNSNQFDDVFVARKYNLWAEQTGYKTITDVTVGNYRRRNLVLVTASREGLSPWHNRFGKIIKRERPSCPLALINSDDNNLDLYFTYGASKTKRVVLYVIIDAFNDYILGYSIDWTATSLGIKMAYLNAIHHIHELTGEFAWWHQLQADHWNSKGMDSFFKVFDPISGEPQVKFTPPKVGNARGKTIERVFGKEWHSFLKLYQNYAGPNITAKSKLNTDVVKRRSKNYPEITHAAAQIEHFIEQLRSKINPKTGLTRRQEWLNAYKAMPQEHKRTLPDKQRLLHYGIAHTHRNTISNAGLNITLDGTQLSYDVSREDFIKHIGRNMQVMFDPYDLSQVLALNDDGRTQLLCPAYEKTKMALLDMQEVDRTRLNSLINEQKMIGQHVFDKQNKRRDVLSTSGIDAEGLLQAGILIKEERHLAENTYYDRLSQNNAEQEVQQPNMEEADDQDDIWDKQLKAGRRAI